MCGLAAVYIFRPLSASARLRVELADNIDKMVLVWDRKSHNRRQRRLVDNGKIRPGKPPSDSAACVVLQSFKPHFFTTKT